MLATTLHSLSLPLGVAAGGALVAWLIALGVLLVSTRPGRPDPVSAGLELGGDSPPAVAGMLVHEWEPGRIDASATLVDLAARGIVAFEPIQDGFQVRLREKRSSEALLPHEAHLLDLVERRAEDGIVPCAALQMQEGRSTDAWFKEFDQLVVADARRRGLSRARFSAAATAVIGALAALAATCVALAVTALADTPQLQDCSGCSHDSGNPWTIALSIAIVGWIFMMVLYRRLDGERDTPAGLAEAGRWLGLRDNLRHDERFGAQHVDAVAVWDRLLAYGVGIGAARTAAHDVPIGAESRHEAWSIETGTWRLVHISYPRHLPPGYGEPIWMCLLGGLLQGVVAAGILVLGVPLISDASRHIRDATTDVHGAWGTLANTSLRVAATFVAIYALVMLVRAVAMLWLALNDVYARQVVEGLVVRSMWHPGSSSHNDADLGGRDRHRFGRPHPGLARTGTASRGVRGRQSGARHRHAPPVHVPIGRGHVVASRGGGRRRAAGPVLRQGDLLGSRLRAPDGSGDRDADDAALVTNHRGLVLVPVGVLAADLPVQRLEEVHRLGQVDDRGLALDLHPLAEEAVGDHQQRGARVATQVPGLGTVLGDADDHVASVVDAADDRRGLQPAVATAGDQHGVVVGSDEVAGAVGGHVLTVGPAALLVSSRFICLPRILVINRNPDAGAAPKNLSMVLVPPSGTAQPRSRP